MVTINYRLGAFGFLVSNAAGAVQPVANAGLLDQQLAMRWVQNNVAAFGGDISRVTLFGESAGSMSISLHFVLPSSRGLFRRVALESGTAFQGQSGPSVVPFYNFDLALNASMRLLAGLGCATLECGRLLHADVIVNAQKVFSWLPVVDGTLIPDVCHVCVCVCVCECVHVDECALLDDETLFYSVCSLSLSFLLVLSLSLFPFSTALLFASGPFSFADASQIRPQCRRHGGGCPR